MFGTSGIRGKYGELVTPGLAMMVGNAIGREGGKAALAMDARNTSPILSNSLASGAMLAGSDVIELGMGPTPLLAYATWREKCDGAMITASHNPPEYNGIKLFSNGMEFPRAREREVEKMLASGKKKSTAWKKAGQVLKKNYEDEYVSFLLSQADAKAIARKKPRVLIDAGNAAACRIAPMIFEKAGCEVIQLYCDSPGKFARNLEPKKETLSDAARLVVEEECDFGVAFDGDGDRAIAIDEKGEVLALDVQLAIFCSHFLEKAGKKAMGAAVISTVEASLCVRESVEALGGKLHITQVGSLHVAHEVLARKAVFGGEPCGEYVFPGSTPCADGVLAALTVAEIFCERGKLSELARDVKTYPIERKKFACEEGKKKDVMKKLSEGLKFSGAKLSTIDGLRHDFEDGWLLIRPSGTEPAIRMTYEFRGEKRLREIAGKAEETIKEAVC